MRPVLEVPCERATNLTRNLNGSERNRPRVDVVLLVLSWLYTFLLTIIIISRSYLVVALQITFCHFGFADKILCPGVSFTIFITNLLHDSFYFGQMLGHHRQKNSPILVMTFLQKHYRRSKLYKGCFGSLVQNWFLCNMSYTVEPLALVSMALLHLGR